MAHLTRNVMRAKMNQTCIWF